MNTSSQQIVIKSAKRNRPPSTCPIESYADGGGARTILKAVCKLNY